MDAGGRIVGRQAKALASSQAAFDWTIRNIQIEELLEYPKAAAAGPTADPGSMDPTADWPPPMRGIPGPGYSKSVWQVLMYGRGDSLPARWIFVLAVTTAAN